MEEFAIGMHLVESAKSGKPLPPVLPANLLPQQFKKTMSESMESENMEGMPGGQIARQRSVSSSSANDELAFLRSGKSKTLRTTCWCLCMDGFTRGGGCALPLALARVGAGGGGCYFL